MMTREEIEKMPAGRKMDAMVAVKLMDWSRAVDTFVPPHGDPRILWGAKWDEEGRPDYLPHYSTDILATWDLVEKLESMNPPILIDIARTSDNGTFAGLEWRVTFREIGTGKRRIADADTVPLAICRAALLMAMRESEK